MSELKDAGVLLLGAKVPSRVRALRAARSQLIGQGMRFVLAGSAVMVVYLLTTIVLADVVGLPFQAALAIGFTTGLVVHFTLQRVFVWANAEGFALPLRRQLPRYLLVATTQYGLTAASTSLLPGLLGLPAEVIYLMTVGLVTSANFFVFRHGVFHANPIATEPPVQASSEEC